MDTALIVARCGLAAVLGLAAVTKVRDMPGSRRALSDFGAPARLVPPLAVGLPLVEGVAAVLLLISATARLGGLLEIALMLAFTAGIGSALRRGERPDCHCFGQVHSKPAGVDAIVRNIVLLAAGAFVLVAGPGPPIASWIDVTSATDVALAAASLAVIGLAYACVELWRENRRLSRGHAMPEFVTLEPGQAAPEFALKALAGDSVLSEQLLAGERTNVMVFTSSNCGPCIELLPQLARWRLMLEDRLGIHVIAAGDVAENRRLAEEHDISLLLDDRAVTADLFGVRATPSAVEIDEAMRVVAPPVAGVPAIEALIRAVLKRPADAGAGAPNSRSA